MTRWIVAVALTLAPMAACKGKPSKTEAEVNLDRLGAVVQAKFAKAGGFPAGRVGPTPPVTCCSQPDKQCGDDASAWQLPLWTELGFSIAGKHRFVYTYEGSATTFTATATGDLNCDGKSVTFSLTGTADNGKVVLVWQKPTMLD